MLDVGVKRGANCQLNIALLIALYIFQDLGRTGNRVGTVCLQDQMGVIRRDGLCFELGCLFSSAVELGCLFSSAVELGCLFSSTVENCGRKRLKMVVGGEKKKTYW